MTFRFLLIGLLLLIGCQTDRPALSVTFDPLFTFPTQATLAWDRERSQVPNDPRLQSLRFGPLIEELAAEAFADKGYTLAEGRGAGFLLSYHVTVQEIVEANKSRSIGAFWLELSEAATGRRVWTGYGRAPMYVGLSEAERKQRLRSNLAKLLKDFPPSQR